MQNVFTKIYSYVFLFLITTVLVLLDMHGFAARVSLAALIVYSSTLTILAFGLYFYATGVGTKLSKKYDWFFYPAVGFAAVTLSSLACPALLAANLACAISRKAAGDSGANFGH